MSARRLTRLGAAAAFLVGSALPALAHHVMGGKMPGTFGQGFLSGLGHPVIGIDHLLFIVGAGLLAGMLGRPLLLPLALVVGAWVGAALHLAGLSIGFNEAAIVVTVALMAAAVIAGPRFPAVPLAALVGVAGLFHGYAYAETIFGAEPTPLYAYLAGFAAVQFAIAFAAAWVFERISTSDARLARTCSQVAGGAMVGVALVAISNMAFGS